MNPLRALLIGLALAAPSAAQGATQPPAQSAGEKQKAHQAKMLAKAEDWMRRWLELDHRDRDEEWVDKVVEHVMDAETQGLDLLARTSQKVAADGDPKLINAVHSITCHLALEWIDKIEKSKTVYAGQWNDLRRLMPDVGEFYLQLLLDTPQWFPDTKRYKVIPALRDLYPKGPPRLVLERIERMAKNVEIEPEYLRVGLAYALAQWGMRDLIKAKIRALEKKAKSGHTEVAFAAMRDLAAIHYGIRDYAMGAVVYRDFIQLAEKARYVLPVYYYNAACCMCLSGDKRTAIQYLEKCLELNASGTIDSSLVLDRKLFDNDPEIQLVRKHPRVIAALKKAFPDDEDASADGKKDGDRPPSGR